jgi:hypothetical protein
MLGQDLPLVLAGQVGLLGDEHPAVEDLQPAVAPENFPNRG